MAGSNVIRDTLVQHEAELLDEWVREQRSLTSHRGESVRESDLRSSCREFLKLLRDAVASGEISDVQGPSFKAVRELLGDICRDRSSRGFSPSETATFVFSLKQPLFKRMQTAAMGNAAIFAQSLWETTILLDKLGLYTTEVYQKAREEVIVRQQQDMLELSTPVVKLWEGILALPLIGTLDSARTQVVMETLLMRIVETGSQTAIIDITGVPTVDTLTAQHLLKTVAAARLMGADCIISGIRPQIAQTVVHLGIDLAHVTTKASLADAFILALQRNSLAVRRVSAAAAQNA